MNVLIITGASSGIGKSFVSYLDGKIKGIDEIWLVARRKAVLEDIAYSCKTTCKIFAMDLTDSVSMNRFAEVLSISKPKIRMLINASGMGYIGPCERIPQTDQAAMVRLNCEALLNMTTVCLPYMHKGSRLIQIASAAAFLPQPGFAVYAASKAFVYHYAEALSVELKKRKIYVTSVCPGPVDTPFFDTAERYEKMRGLKKWFKVSPEKVVRDAFEASKGKKRICIPGFCMKLFYVLCKIMPHSLFYIFMRIK